MEEQENTNAPMIQTLALLAENPSVDPCDLACDSMPGYVIGDLTNADESWLRLHTSVCNYCRGELESFELVDDLLERATANELSLPNLRLPMAPQRPLARWGLVSSPIGNLYVAVSDKGICEIAFAGRGVEGFFAELESRGFQVEPDQDSVTVAASQLQEYFGGDRVDFDVSVDLTGVSPFTRSVLDATAAVPFGTLTTYQEIARRIGKPAASRAVGNALGRNPIPVIVPCHRIVRSDWSMGGYTGGLDIKQKLLAIEGSALPQ